MHFYDSFQQTQNMYQISKICIHFFKNGIMQFNVYIKHLGLENVKKLLVTLIENQAVFKHVSCFVNIMNIQYY